MNKDKVEQATEEFIKSIMPSIPNDVLEIVMEELKKNPIVLNDEKELPL